MAPYSLGLDEEEIKIMLVVTQVLLQAERDKEGKGVAFLRDWIDRKNVDNLKAVVEDMDGKFDLPGGVDYQVAFLLENLKGIEYCFECWLTAVGVGTDLKNLFI